MNIGWTDHLRYLLRASVCMLAFAVGLVGAVPPETVTVTLVEAKTPAFDEAAAPQIRLPMHWISQCDSVSVRLEIRITPLSNGQAPGVTPVLMKGDGTALAIDTVDQVSVTREVIELGPRKTLRLTLEAVLLDPGTYRAVVQTTVITASGKRLPLEPLALTIKRSISVLPVEFAAVPALPVTLPWLFWAGSKGPPSFTLQAYTAGDTMRLPQVHLASLARKDSIDATGDGETTSLDLAATQPPGQPIEVKSGVYTDVPVVFNEVPRAGRYDAKLRFASEGYKPAEATVVILARESKWVMVFFVFIGALLSFAIQLWGGFLKPWRDFKQRLGALTAAVVALRTADGAARDEELQLLDRILENLRESFDATPALLRWRIASRLGAFEALLPPLRLWSSRWRELPQIQPAEVRTAFRDKLLTLAEPLRSANPDATKLREANASLEALPGQLRQAIATVLTEELKTLEEQLGDDARVELTPVRAQLRAVRARLQAGQLEAAIGLYHQMLQTYAKAMADELRARADKNQMQPQGLTAQEWQTLCTDTARELDAFARQSDPEQALARLQEATAVFVQGMASALVRAVAQLADAARKPVEDAAHAVNQAVQQHNLVAAWRELDRVRQGYQAAQAIARQVMGPEQVELLRGLTSPLADPSILGTVLDLPRWWADSAQAGAAPRIAQQTLTVDIAVSLVVLLVSAISAVQGLWDTNPVWGGVGAFLGAMATGFAADRFAHSAMSAFRKPDAAT